MPVGISNSLCTSHESTEYTDSELAAHVHRANKVLIFLSVYP